MRHDNNNGTPCSNGIALHITIVYTPGGWKCSGSPSVDKNQAIVVPTIVVPSKVHQHLPKIE